jgi:hypothetical protein
MASVLAHAIRVSPDGHVRHTEHVADLLERLAGLPHLDCVGPSGRTETRTAADPNAGSHGPNALSGLKPEEAAAQIEDHLTHIRSSLQTASARHVRFR